LYWLEIRHEYRFAAMARQNRMQCVDFVYLPFLATSHVAFIRVAGVIQDGIGFERWHRSHSAPGREGRPGAELLRCYTRECRSRRYTGSTALKKPLGETAARRAALYLAFPSIASTCSQLTRWSNQASRYFGRALR